MPQNLLMHYWFQPLVGVSSASFAMIGKDSKNFIACVAD